MQSTTILLLLSCIMGVTLASPMPEDFTMPSTPPPQYPLNLKGEGGGQRGEGFGFDVRGRENVWRSDNGRHEIDLHARYGQHLGGPSGNSRPSYEFGPVYRYRW